MCKARQNIKRLPDLEVKVSRASRKYTRGLCCSLKAFKYPTVADFRDTHVNGKYEVYKYPTNCF